MRKKWCLILTLMLMLLVMLIPSIASAAEVDIETVHFHVVINGHRVENNYRKYPLIFYNSITYFPMTYNDCAYLGISNTWSPEKGNIIEKAAPFGFYDDSLDPLNQGTEVKGKAKIVTSPVTILGTQLNNEAEQYPILSYKDVLYFPLTWDWAQKFGWTVELNSYNLEITTAGFARKGKVVIYDVAHGGAEKVVDNLYYSKSDYHTKTSTGNIYSPSKNYTFYKDPIEGFVTLYRFFNDGTHNNFCYINIKEELAGSFLENGWFKAADLQAYTHEFLKTNTKRDAKIALSNLVRVTTLKSALLTTTVSDVIWNVLPQYTTLYSYPANVTSVRNEEVDAYKNVGWFTGVDYVYSLMAARDNAGDTDGALRVLEAFYFRETENILGVAMPTMEDENINYYLSANYQSLAKKLYPKLKNNVVFAYSYTNDYGDIVLVMRGQSVKGLKEIHYTLSYDMYDASGNYMGTASQTAVDTFWKEEGNQINSYNHHYVEHKSNPEVASVANVKVTNVKIVDYEVGFEG